MVMNAVNYMKSAVNISGNGDDLGIFLKKQRNKTSMRDEGNGRYSDKRLGMVTL